MANSVKDDSLTLDTFLDQLLDVQLCDNTPMEAQIARQEVERIIGILWRHYEASQRALGKAMAELRECREAHNES